MNRRQFLTSTTIGALAAAAAPRAALAQGKTGTVRVWGEPGPYGGVAVDGMNEWAQKNAPGLKFAIEAKSKRLRMSFALGRTIATDYYVISLLHSAGGRMFDAANKSEVVFDSPAAVETFEYIAELFPTMPPGSVGYTFLDVVDSMAKGQTGIAFYWGRVFGRAAEVDPSVFATMEAY